VSFSNALAIASSRPTDVAALEQLASAALDAGEEERALPLLARAVAQRPSARLWQWKGLLERALDEHEDALVSLSEAARLDPQDASIAHGLARTALEAGVPAETLFERARALAPVDGSVLIGLGAARAAAGHGEEGAQELEAILAQVPLWLDGQLQLAQLRSTLGAGPRAVDAVERALAATPQQPQLWQLLFDLHAKREDFAALLAAVERSKQAGAPRALTRVFEAVASGELGMTEQADRLYAEVEAAGGAGIAMWRVRHLLRSGRPEEAKPIIDAELGGPGAAVTWPYAAAAWRMTGDPRSDWLEGASKLVSVVDLAPDLPPIEQLAAALRALHIAKGEYLDQSVRGGTQTDGPLFSRVDPVIRALRSAVVRAVEKHVAQLPPADPRHPLLGPRRDRRIRFAGSWSVRLRDSGFHTSHVHPQGWISSALYVALPEEKPDGDLHAGWLQLGAPPADLRTGLEPLRLIKPEPGKLVLFPSWMWHGTVPFPAGERLTVAFDVAPPR
jgi:tetratricopeptide (TPR) repeat protein